MTDPDTSTAPRRFPRALMTSAGMGVLYGRFPSLDGAYARRVLWDDAGGAVVRETVATGRPCMIGRLGSVELGCASYRTRWRSGAIRLPYPGFLRSAINLNAGVFPADDASLDRFSDIFLAAVTKADVFGVCLHRNEEPIVARYCPTAKLVHLEAMNAVIRDDPWTTELEGKTVLVVHPFARTIESQYRTKRTLLFKDPRILPEFELKTLTAVQSGAGNDCGFATWPDALEHMRSEIARTEFDIAIIGAGAYGLPLAASVKDMGRQAVHLGGATQLLFGIRGRRWETEAADVIAPLFNEYWVRPSAQETPAGCSCVEGGCYW